MFLRISKALLLCLWRGLSGMDIEMRTLRLYFYTVGHIAASLFLTGCAATLLQNDLTTTDGRKISLPLLSPGNTEEIGIICNYQVEKLGPGSSFAPRELRECREGRQARLRDDINECRHRTQQMLPKGTSAKIARDAVDLCVRQGKVFADEFRKRQEFDAYALAKTPEDFESFARRYERNDGLLLVADAKKRAAVACAVGPSVTAPLAVHRDWVTRFEFMADNCQQAFVQVRGRIVSMERAAYTQEIENLASWERANDFLRSNAKTLPDDLARITVAKRASLRQAAINSGDFSAVLPLAHDGDREAILRAVSLAVSNDQRVVIDQILLNTNEVELVLTHGGFYALLFEAQRQGRNGDRRVLGKLLDAAQTEEQKEQAQLALQKSDDIDLILARGNFKTTLIYAQSGVQRAVKRSYELAKTDAEKR